MIKKLLQVLKEELMTNSVNNSEKCCGECRYLELIPFDDYRCMNSNSELFHCNCHPKEDVCKEFIEKE